MIHTLYDGQVTLDFDPRKHAYTVNGEKVPSVTSIVGVLDKPALIWWAVNCTVDFLAETLQPNITYTSAQLKAILDDSKKARFRKSKEALNIGSDAHDWLERYVKSKVLNYQPPELPTYPPVLNAVQSYLDWERGQDIKYLSSERVIYGRAANYCGTCDLTLDWNGRFTVADFKTSKDIYPEYWLQVAAYANAITEEDRLNERPQLAIIRIPKDGEAVEIQSVDDEEYFDLLKVFYACLGIYNWKAAK